ncbi:MAG TPA: transporter substrate-binding domain-containing protein [Telluria sp.]|jgi:polar amino acid transport system substrate-binding protein
MDRFPPSPNPIRRAVIAGTLAVTLLPVRAAPRELLVVGGHFARVYERADGNFSGMGPDILRALAGALGQSLHFDLVPWARAQSMVAKGQADLLVGPYKSPERQALFSFSERAFYVDEMVFYARAGELFIWDGRFASLRNKRIVCINGWAYGDAFDAARPHLHLHQTNSVEAGLAMLAHGRVDLFATNRRNTEGVVPFLELQGKVAPLERIITTQHGYFAFPRLSEYEAIVARFDRAFNAFAERGELQRLGRRLDVRVE